MLVKKKISSKKPIKVGRTVKKRINQSPAPKEVEIAGLEFCCSSSSNKTNNCDEENEKDQFLCNKRKKVIHSSDTLQNVLQSNEDKLDDRKSPKILFSNEVFYSDSENEGESSGLILETEVSKGTNEDEENICSFLPSVQSTPLKKRGLKQEKNNIEVSIDEHSEIMEVEQSVDKSVKMERSVVSDSMVDILLESSDDENVNNNMEEGPKTFTKDDIVWEMWYKNAKSKGRVQDCDLNPSPPLVLARLCVVTSTSKKVKGKGEMVGLLPIPGDGSALDTKMSGHTNNSKFVRNFGTLIKNKLIVNSQRHRKDFQTVVEQVDLAEKYLTNHVGLETIPAEEVKTFREFLSMGTWDQCIYLEGLRRLKKGLDKQIPKRGDSFDESLEREGIYNVDSDDKEVVDEEDEDETEEALVEKNAIHIDMDESYLETLDREMQDLVAPLSKNWPLEWMKTKSEISKLKRIMTRKKNCRRHEMFMDSKQRNVRNNLPELLKMSNNSFMNIFGKKRESIDRDIRIYLLENVFNKTKISKEFDPRLTNLLAQSLDHGRQYIELVLYPELFISWLSVTRNCWYLEADRFYQTVGQVVSQKEIDRLAEEWLQGGKRSPVFNSDSESEDS